VSYLHLALSKPILAYFLTNSPTAMLAILDEVALQAILVYYPAYERIHAEVHVRIADLPLSTSLRDLRGANLNNLVRVAGVVTRRTGVFPQLKYVKFDCRKCGAVLGPFYQDSMKEMKISQCPHCESRGPFSVNQEQARRYYVPPARAYLTRIPDRVPELPEDDPPRVTRIRACRSPSAAS
jgi:DNA replication licensing factor MCM2